MSASDDSSGGLVRILVVDDDQVVLDVLRTMLAMEEFQVTVAHDGGEAMVRIREDRPHLVVLDVMMPGMDGINVCEHVKGDPDLRDTRVILLTALDSENDRQRGLKAGADVYLTKPFSPLELLETVEALLGKEDAL